MVTTVTEQDGGNSPSNIGQAALKKYSILMDGTIKESAPILLGGLKLVSLHALTLTSTDITIEGANFSSSTDSSAENHIDGHRIPVAADFSPLFDQTDTEIIIAATTGDKLWDLPDVGFALWIRIKFSVAQVRTIHIAAKG